MRPAVSCADQVKYQPFMGVMGVAPPPGMQLEQGLPIGVISTGE